MLRRNRSLLRDLYVQLNPRRHPRLHVELRGDGTTIVLWSDAQSARA
jgi:hypothetical protein